MNDPRPRMTLGEPGPDLSSDVYAGLLKDRVVVLGEAIDDAVANLVTAQLLHLESEDPEKDITLHINSPGGPSSSLLAIYDTMQHVRPDVSTVCVGQAGSAAAVLLAAGAHGKRFALPHARIMLRQPQEEIGGDAASIEIHASELLRRRRLVDEILARHTGQPMEKVSADTERDFFLSPEEAKEYGIVDRVLTDRAAAIQSGSRPGGSRKQED
jgi:ATP-dependent Clp protease protease subunit